MSSIRELLLAAHKRAQDEADIRRFELEEYERANGFVRRCQKGIDTTDTLRLDANRALYEVTGRRTAAGAEGSVPLSRREPVAVKTVWSKTWPVPETYTRRNAEDIHD